MEKVLVMARTARPHICSAGEIFWDGKIGIFPFIEQVVAKKNSKNRHAGTVETKALQSITKSIIRSVLMKKCFSKWPLGACKEIWIQQDYARPHISPNDTEFVEVATKDELLQAIENAYNAYDPKSLNYTWLHMQYCMLEILQVNGGNDYKNPHKGKRRLERMGQLPVQIEVPSDMMLQGQSFIDEGHTDVNNTQEDSNEHNMSQRI
ncbi:uncharacterized protein LOC110691692 [Chenopodium quinoa]|uniref:uncharacterized protein LOC110691692 n=1 Tax=Chenopodium quinoa TaxID=63459 RepID=UPI000B78230E|nr:uncharacterized protein LOC110691692 [Chenopodium quinoa]